MFRTLIAAALALVIAAPTFADPTGEAFILPPSKRKLNGPRLGFTYVAQSDLLSRKGTMNEKLKEKNIGAAISQFGWQFEWIVAPSSESPAFVTELVPMLGGVEYGTVLPSCNLVFGIRMPSGIEFGMGPNVLFTLDRDEVVTPSLIASIGKNFALNGVNIPVNFAVTTSEGGTRGSLVFGYCLRKW